MSSLLAGKRILNRKIVRFYLTCRRSWPPCSPHIDCSRSRVAAAHPRRLIPRQFLFHRLPPDSAWGEAKRHHGLAAHVMRLRPLAAYKEYLQVTIIYFRRPRPGRALAARAEGRKLPEADADPGADHSAPYRRARICSASPRPEPARRRRSRCPSCSVFRSSGCRARRARPHALILAPTRELASQIGERFAAYGRRPALAHRPSSSAASTSITR